MQKSKIEWLRDPTTGKPGYSVNPIKGICKMGCDYCYAIKQYHRFKWTEVRLDMHAFDGIEKIHAGSKIFVCSTHDLFGSWIPTLWKNQILTKAQENPHLTFIFLTKKPQNLTISDGIKDIFCFPDNAWIGVSVESQKQVWRIKTLLQPEIKASMKFVSFEPLQGEIDCDFVNPVTLEYIKWMIIGAETGNRKDKIKPEHDWIMDLMHQHADTPVFLKNNLKSQSGCYYGDLYQDFPRIDANSRHH